MFYILNLFFKEKVSRYLNVNNGNGYVENGMVDPTMFVALYKHASYIITNSFHGTAFSLMFNRPFDVVSVSSEVDSRAKNLLYQVGLEDRMINLPCDCSSARIDWSIVNQKMDDLRKPSRVFINEALR